MKKFFLFITILLTTAVVLAPLACKKEITPTTESRVLLCTEAGTAWENAGLYYDVYFPFTTHPEYPQIHTLVYNNKHYLFRNLKVVIFDGTGWDSIPSAVPFTIHQYHNHNFSFTIGNKGYIGLTDPLNPNHSFWEYDFALNTWAQKANFPGINRQNASYFSINSKGYVVAGGNDNPRTWNLRDTWEYDPATNSWTQKASLPAFLGHSHSTGFSINNKGYIVNGWKRTTGNPESIYLNHLLEYNPATDTWAQKANFPGIGRIRSAVFIIAGEVYIGGGFNYYYIDNSYPYVFDMYKYNPVIGSWSSVAPLPGPSILGFALNSYGYTVYYNYAYTSTMYKGIPKTCIPNPLP